MTRRSTLFIIVGLAILAGGALYWRLSQHAVRPSAPPGTAEQREAAAWLALRIQVFPAGPDDDVLIEVSAYDRRARQAEIVRDAAKRGYRGGAASAATASARVLPEGWASRLRLESGQTVLAHQVMTTAGDGASAVLRLNAAVMSSAPASVVALLAYDDGEARSNAVAIARTATSPEARLVALGTQAALVADLDRVAALGTELMAVAPASPWGHYFTGVALEARGEREPARAAFRRALALTTPGFEAPIGLVARIRNLGG